jgi:hypothetical protein
MGAMVDSVGKLFSSSSTVRVAWEGVLWLLLSKL